MASVGSLLAGAAFVKLTMEDAELKHGLDKAQNKFKAFEAGINAFGTKMTEVAPLLSAPLLSATKTFAAFDDQMQQVRAFANATEQEFKALTETAKRLGRETSFTASQVAAGMSELGKSGFKPTEIENSIHPMMNLARATGSDLAQASTIAANAMRTFRMETSEATNVADLLVATANASAIDLADIGESLKMAGSAAASVGEDFRDVMAAVGVLGNMGLKGTMAGTGLRSAYLRLADPKIRAGLKDLGVDATDAQKNMRKLADVMTDLAKAMNNMPTADRLALAKKIFEVEGTPTGINFISNISEIEAFRKNLDQSAGAAQKAADAMDSGIGGALRNLSSAAEGVSIALGEIIAVTFTPLIKSLSTLLLGIRELIGENSKLVAGFIQLAAAPVAFGAALKSLGVAGGILKSMLSPILALDTMLNKAAISAKNQEKAEVAAAAQAANAEKLKQLAKTRSDAIRVASENRRHYEELKNAAAEAQSIVAAEGQKLAAAKARVAAEAALNEKARYNYTLATGSSQGFVPLPGYTKAQAGLKAQEEAMRKSIASSNQAATAMAAAKTETLASAAAAKTAGAAYMTEAAAQTASNRKSMARATLLGKLSTSELLWTSITFKRANVVMATSVAEMVAAKRGASASAIKTVGYYAEAIAAKVAAGATIALGKALTVISAHPILFALIAVSAAIMGIAKSVSAANEELDKAAVKAKKFAAAATEIRESGDQNRTQAKINMTRLKQLEEISMRGKLSAEQMSESEKLINSLDPYGASQWASLDAVTGKLNLATDAQQRFNEEMRETAKIELESEIARQEKAIESLQQTLSYSSVRAFFGGTHLGKILTLWQLDSLEEHNDPIYDKIDSENKKLMAMKKRYAALKAGEDAAVTGKNPDESTKANIDEYNQKKIASEQELSDAEDRLRKMEEDAARSKISNLEREIDEIQKLRAEYNKYIDLLIESENIKFDRAIRMMQENRGKRTETEKDFFAKAQADVNAALASIESLRSRQSAMNADFDQQEKNVLEKDEKRRQESYGRYDSFLGDLDSKEAENLQRRQEEKIYDDTMNKKNFDAAYQYVAGLFNTQAEALRLAREKYTQMLENAKNVDSEGGADISDTERKELDAMQREIEEASARSNALQEKMNRARDAADEAGTGEPAVRATGAWSLAELNSALGGGSAADRTAKATEKTVLLTQQSLEQQKKQNQKLDELKKQNEEASATLVYT